MKVVKHPAYKEEKERLDYVVEYLKNTIEATEEYRKIYKENIKDAMIELDFLDSSQSYINILINSKFMDIAEKNYDNFLKAVKKPYFARMDYKPAGSKEIDKMYIGKTSLYRAEDNVPLIIDWRSPVANIYYEGRLGDVSYETELGEEKGELLLKRQFTIEKGKLLNVLDVDITTNDEFLQGSLGANADNRLKDIASTIQAEQNKIIRADMHRPLIVQGAAGSGKTTIALHRIAYFIYTYEETFDPDNFMIMGPNKVFMNYISEVLPELGVEEVKQTTFIDFMTEIVGKQFKIIDPDDKLVNLIHQSMDKEEESLMRWSSAYKGSLVFKNLLEEYIKDIEKDFLPKDDFTIGEYVLMSNDEIEKMFMEDLSYLPLYKRIGEIKKSLSNRLKHQKKLIIEKIETSYNRKIEHIRDTMEETEERRSKLITLFNERNDILDTIRKKSNTLVKKYLSLFPNKKLLDYYKELMTNKKYLIKYGIGNIEQEKLDYLSNLSQELLTKKKIEVEDFAALAYLQHKILGFSKKISISSIVIDEAQDYSVFQIYVLKEILNTRMFTLLGDLSQGIYSYRGIRNWDEILGEVFDEKESTYMALTQSYRTTVEIMNFANKIIKLWTKDENILAKPVIRHGVKPEFNTYQKEQDLYSQLGKRITEMQEKKYRSIAVICKTLKECEKAKRYIDKSSDLKNRIIGEKEEHYEAGIIIVPSHLAKGLEFDAVIIVNIDEKYIKEELDIKLLYVAMTRALHELHFLCMDNTIPLLEDIVGKYS